MLRVASYNVRSLRDDRAALVRVVTAMGADVVCVQEAPRFPGWRRRRRELARDTGMTVAAGGRVGGVAVLAGPAVRVLDRRDLRLRPYPGLQWRAAALAVVEKDGARYAVCSIHLDLHGGARLRHAVQIAAFVEEAARAHRAAAVVAGDLNERPGGPAWSHLARRYADCFAAAPRGDGGTFPAAGPAMRIDAVFADPRLEVVACGGADVAPADLAASGLTLAGVAPASLTPACLARADLVAASDHRPVVADVRPRHTPLEVRPRHTLVEIPFPPSHPGARGHAGTSLQERNPPFWTGGTSAPRTIGS
jgi:endonuclease/exonuclease/phosphatase family metal-dependent hydrolase